MDSIDEIAMFWKKQIYYNLLHSVKILGNNIEILLLDK